MAKLLRPQVSVQIAAIRRRGSEKAEALALCQAGESSIIGCLAVAVTASLNDVLGWVYW